MQTSPFPLATPSTRTEADAVDTSVAGRRGALHLVRCDDGDDGTIEDDYAALEQELLDFDADEDIAALVPMPRSIPAPMRRALTQAFAQAFSSYDALDAWLHESNAALADTSPFEMLVSGCGFEVLAALSSRSGAGSLRGLPIVPHTLRLV